MEVRFKKTLPWEYPAIQYTGTLYSMKRIALWFKKHKNYEIDIAVSSTTMGAINITMINGIEQMLTVENGGYIINFPTGLEAIPEDYTKCDLTLVE